MTSLHKSREEWRKLLSSKTASNHSNDLEIQAIEDLLLVYDFLELGTINWCKTLAELDEVRSVASAHESEIANWRSWAEGREEQLETKYKELSAANGKIEQLEEQVKAWQQLHDANSRTFDEVKERHHRSWQLMSDEHYLSTRENTELKNIIKDSLPEIWKIWQEDRKNKKDAKNAKI